MTKPPVVVNSTPTETISEQKQPLAKSLTKAEKLSLTLLYAHAVAKATTVPENIRNINIIGTPEETSKISTLLRKENLFADLPLLIKPKGKVNFTYKCDDPATADTIAQKLTEKYGNANFKINKIRPTLPQLKIAKLYPDSAHGEEILAQLFEQNQLLQRKELSVLQSYRTIPDKNEPYSNIIISCDLDTHSQLLAKGKLVFGFAEAKLYEYVNVLMCNH